MYLDLLVTLAAANEDFKRSGFQQGFQRIGIIISDGRAAGLLGFRRGVWIRALDPEDSEEQI